jgi:hypothetical protein
MTAFERWRRAVLLMTVLEVGAIYPAGAAGQPAESELGSVRVSSQPRRIAGRNQVVSLWRQEVPQRTGERSVPLAAFFLVVSSPTDTTHGRIVWSEYGPEGVPAPSPRWMAGFASPDGGNPVYVVVAKSITWHVEFRVYRADLDQDLGSFPVDLDRVPYRRWPRALPPISTYGLNLIDGEISGIAAIRVEAEGNGIAIYCKRDSATTPPVAFHFDANTKIWSKLTRNKLVSETYRGAGRDEVLNLWRQDIPQLGADVAGYLKLHPDKNAFPNTAFLLVVSRPEDEARGHIAWITYEYAKPVSPGSGLPEAWLVDMARPIRGDQLDLVLLKAMNGADQFRVYHVDLKQELGSFPIDLQPVAVERWPPAARPLSTHDSTLSWLADIQVTAQAGGLAVRCERGLVELPPVVFRYDPGKNQWSQTGGSSKQ